eukprot:6176190-Pleurochrysis_carterae.AAC.1
MFLYLCDCACSPEPHVVPASLGTRPVLRPHLSHTVFFMCRPAHAVLLCCDAHSNARARPSRQSSYSSICTSRSLYSRTAVARDVVFC